MTDVATGNALSPSDVEPASGPYVDHEDHVDDHVRWIGKVLAADPAAAAEAQRLAARVAETRARDHRIPLLWMQDRLGLSNTEMAVVWLLLAHELDPDARAAVRELNTEHVSDATFDTIRRVVYGLRAASRTWRELGPDGKLRSLGLLERTDGNGDAPQQRQTFKIARRVLALAHGVTAIDPAISQLAKLVAPGVHVDALELPHGVVEQLRAVMTTEAPQLVLVVGCQGTGRRSVLLALAARPVLVVDGRVIAPQRDKAQQQLAVIARECRLLGCIPLFQHVDALAGSGDILDRLDLLESALDGLTLATSTKPIARRWQRPPAVIVLGALSGAQRARLWRRALPQASDADAELLATMYPLAPALIEAAGRVATRQCGQADMQPAHIEAGIRSVLDHRLAGLADRVTVTQSWKDLVLPEDQTTAMLELLARIRERRRVYEDWGFAEKVGRGLGVTALFSGPPGTGKTMAGPGREQPACRAVPRRHLPHRLEVDRGDREEPRDALRRGRGRARDPLFGQRTEVRSSNDRHANQEVNYLLQRMESFSGICILTTNHEHALDEAFRRRLSVQIRFPLPEADERKLLWRALLPKAAPLARDLDLDMLAETFAMSGGYIRNAVLRAAFLAADEGSAIHQRHLRLAAQLEYEAMGKLAPSTGSRQT